MPPKKNQGGVQGTQSQKKSRKACTTIPLGEWIDVDFEPSALQVQKTGNTKYYFEGEEHQSEQKSQPQQQLPLDFKYIDQIIDPEFNIGKLLLLPEASKTNKAPTFNKEEDFPPLESSTQAKGSKAAKAISQITSIDMSDFGSTEKLLMDENGMLIQSDDDEHSSSEETIRYVGSSTSSTLVGSDFKDDHFETMSNFSSTDDFVDIRSTGDSNINSLNSEAYNAIDLEPGYLSESENDNDMKLSGNEAELAAIEEERKQPAADSLVPKPLLSDFFTKNDYLTTTNNKSSTKTLSLMNMQKNGESQGQGQAQAGTIYSGKNANRRGKSHGGKNEIEYGNFFKSAHFDSRNFWGDAKLKGAQNHHHPNQNNNNAKPNNKKYNNFYHKNNYKQNKNRQQTQVKQQQQQQTQQQQHQVPQHQLPQHQVRQHLLKTQSEPLPSTPSPQQPELEPLKFQQLQWSLPFKFPFLGKEPLQCFHPPNDKLFIDNPFDLYTSVKEIFEDPVKFFADKPCCMESYFTDSITRLLIKPPPFANDPNNNSQSHTESQAEDNLPQSNGGGTAEDFETINNDIDEEVQATMELHPIKNVTTFNNNELLGLSSVLRCNNESVAHPRFDPSVENLSFFHNSMLEDFVGPFANLPRSESLIIQIKPEYQMNSYIRTRLLPVSLTTRSEEFIFFLFYTKTQETNQLDAAEELARRNWRYHKILSVWMKVLPGQLYEVFGKFMLGCYQIFDFVSWRIIHRRMDINLDSLELKLVIGEDNDPKTSNLFDYIMIMKLLGRHVPQNITVLDSKDC